MKNISLQQYVPCSSNPNQLVVGVNCKSWELKENSIKNGCEQYCNLKNKKTNFRECYICKERVALNEIKENVNEKVYTNPAEELKDKLPQHNFFTKEKMDKYRMHKNTNQSFVDKAKSYTRAELSQMFTGKVTEEVYEKRKEFCMSCPNRSNPYPNQESIGWCKSCGCSAKNPRAALSNKLWMPSLVCPLNKFGKEIGSGFKPQDAVDSVKGALDSVVSLFKKEDENEKTNIQEDNQQEEKAE
jgi:hypothetical protein